MKVRIEGLQSKIIEFARRKSSVHGIVTLGVSIHAERADVDFVVNYEGLTSGVIFGSLTEAIKYYQKL